MPAAGVCLMPVWGWQRVCSPPAGTSGRTDRNLSWLQRARAHWWLKLGYLLYAGFQHQCIKKERGTSPLLAWPRLVQHRAQADAQTHKNQTGLSGAPGLQTGAQPSPATTTMPCPLGAATSTPQPGRYGDTVPAAPAAPPATRAPRSPRPATPSPRQAGLGGAGRGLPTAPPAP